MLCIRHFAIASVAGVAFAVGPIGCQAERPEVIPSSAQLMDSGNGMIHYTAPSDGTVYAYDHSANRLIWSGKVLKGQSVDLDTQKNQVMVSGRIVADKTLSGADRNDIYFEAAAEPVIVPAPPPPPAPAASVNPPSSNYNNGVTVAPSVTVQPDAKNGSYIVQPNLNIVPASQPSVAAPVAPQTSPSQQP